VAGRNTDKDWEKYGKEDAYYGVLSDEKFRKSQLTEDLKQEFFHSGETYIADILAKIRQRFQSDWTIGKAVDFGCGVGRLVIPLAKHAQEVTGIDVSESMLAEARKIARNAIFKM
jgi:2-polyprenyl-3-methyl-5-hydroxy-6-metoxy-1,4-benzoquinol methylase